MSRKNDQCSVNKTSNHLAAIRRTRGFSAVDLAGRVGVSRQTIHAIEAEAYVPNTLVALKLARALDVSVEDIFPFPEEDAARETPVERVTLLPDREWSMPGNTCSFVGSTGKWLPPLPRLSPGAFP